LRPLRAPCSTAPVRARWQAAGAVLPIMGEKHFGGAVTIARHGKQALRAAVSFPGESSVTFFSHSGHETASWLPAGEARTHAPVMHLSFAEQLEHLLLSSADGAVAKLEMKTGAITAVRTAMEGHHHHPCRAVCHLSDGALARLAVKEGDAPEPMLFLG